MTEEKIASTSTSEAWLSRDIAKILTGIIITVVIASGAAAAFYIHFLGELPIARNDPSGWGQLGDFLGGVLNPVFSFLTIIALVLTLILQSRELRLSREELELSREELRNSAEALRGQNKAIDRQSFEQTFFSWLSTYQGLIAALEQPTEKEVLRDKRALGSWWAQRLISARVWSVRTKAALPLPRNGSTSASSGPSSPGSNWFTCSTTAIPNGVRTSNAWPRNTPCSTT